jgi:FKBP-type peptidyl-prolyl cis-trans isomerase
MNVTKALLFGTLAVACQSRVPEPQESAPVSSPSAAPASATAAAAPTLAASVAPAPAASAAKAVTSLLKEDVKVGKGPAAKAGDTVRVHYTGTLLNGTKFDSSLDRNEPFELKLGAGMVIKGWDEGIPGMKVGGKRKLTIPSDMAYGKNGHPPVIPPDSPLVFDVELMEIVPAAAP